LAFLQVHGGTLGAAAAAGKPGGPACLGRRPRLWSRPVNVFILGWFWRGLRGHSVTFSLLFASFLLGVSLSGGVKRLLAVLGVHWLYVLILPVVLFSWLNAREPQWIPDETRRRRIARSLLFGSIVLAVVINQIRT
jgi:ATP/ADP translocase